MKLLGVDKLQKLSQMVKEHGGLKGALYQIYWTDDLKVSNISYAGILLTTLTCSDWQACWRGQAR